MIIKNIGSFQFSCLCFVYVDSKTAKLHTKKQKKMLKKLKKKKDKNRAVVCLSINKTKTMGTLSSTRASNAVARIGIYCNEKRYQCAVCESLSLFRTAKLTIAQVLIRDTL